MADDAPKEEVKETKVEEKSTDRCHCNDDERGHLPGGIHCLKAYARKTTEENS